MKHYTSKQKQNLLQLICFKYTEKHIDNRVLNQITDYLIDKPETKLDLENIINNCIKLNFISRIKYCLNEGLVWNKYYDMYNQIQFVNHIEQVQNEFKHHI